MECGKLVVLPVRHAFECIFCSPPQNRIIKLNVEVLSDANANLDFSVLRRSQSRPCQLCSRTRRSHWRSFATILHSSRTTYKSAMFCARDNFPGFERILRFETLIGERNKKWHKTLVSKEAVVLRWWGRMIHENFGFIKRSWWRSNYHHETFEKLTLRALALRHSLWRTANARNITFPNLSRW